MNFPYFYTIFIFMLNSSTMENHVMCFFTFTFNLFALSHILMLYSSSCIICIICSKCILSIMTIVSSANMIRKLFRCSWKRRTFNGTSLLFLEGYISASQRFIIHSWVRSRCIIDVIVNWTTDPSITNPWLNCPVRCSWKCRSCIIKISGPNIDSWGTPWIIDFTSNFTPCYWT